MKKKESPGKAAALLVAVCARLIAAIAFYMFAFAIFSPQTAFAQESEISTAETHIATTEAHPPAVYSTAVREVMASTSEAPARKKVPFKIDGYISNKYVYRNNGPEKDQDLYHLFALNAGDRLRNRVTAHVFLRFSEDIDGNDGRIGYYLWDDLYDGFGDHADFALYYAYLDIHRFGFIEYARLGRQTIYESPAPITFDGVRIESFQSKSPFRPKFAIYGGFPSNRLYDTDTADALYGAWLQFRPWIGGKAQVHWTHISEDDKLYGNISDDLFAVKAWHNFGKNAQAHVAYSFFDDRGRDALARFSYQRSEWDFSAQVTYRALFEAESARALAFDSYYKVMGSYKPYMEIGALVHKGFAKKFGIDAGFNGRKMNDKNEEGPYNYEFARYFLAASLRDFPINGVFASVSADYYDSYSYDSGDLAVGGEVGYQYLKKLRACIGSDFAMFDYNRVYSKESVESRGYYAKLRFNPINALTLDASYRFEIDDFGEYDILEAGVKYAF